MSRNTGDDDYALQLSEQVEMNAREKYLFETHSKTKIADWCAKLKWFRFCRAYGGHANDGDSFRASIEFVGEIDLLRIAQLFGVELNRLPPDNPKPVIGVSYAADEYLKFRSEIKDFPHYEQPGWQMIFGVSAFIWVGNGQIDIHLSGAADANFYNVTELDFENARTIENHLEPFNLRFVHPTKECLCLCSECYP